jgi:hypothetical protein
MVMMALRVAQMQVLDLQVMQQALEEAFVKIIGSTENLEFIAASA